MRRLPHIASSLLLFAITQLALAEGVTLPPHHSVELDNGIVFILHEKRDVPLLAIRAFVSGGAVTDPDGKGGLSSVLAEMLGRGAGERDAAAFNDAIDGVGGSLRARAELEGISIAGKFLSRDTGLAVDLLIDMLQSPLLDSRELRKVRDWQVDRLRSAKDNARSRINAVYGTAWLFGDHPYGNPVSGDEASLASITHRDLVAHYDNHVGADRTIITLVGDFDAQEMIGRLSAAFEGWRSAAAPLPEIAPPVPQEGRRVLLVDNPGSTQTYFWMGNIGIDIHYAKRAELEIANALFGGRFGSMLVDALRTKAGLTYGAWSELAPHKQPGHVAVASFTKTDSTVAAIDLALETLHRLHDEGFDEDQISSGKTFVLGQFPFDFETAAQLAEALTRLAANGLDVSHIDGRGDAVAAATSESIHDTVADVYPLPENLAIIIVGDAALIREDIARYGEVTEMSISEPRFTP
jgi:predicted Zn-dependent peptidase